MSKVNFSTVVQWLKFQTLICHFSKSVNIVHSGAFFFLSFFFSIWLVKHQKGSHWRMECETYIHIENKHNISLFFELLCIMLICSSLLKTGLDKYCEAVLSHRHSLICILHEDKRGNCVFMEMPIS